MEIKMRLTRRQLNKLIREHVLLKEGKFISKAATFDFRLDDPKLILQMEKIKGGGWPWKLAFAGFFTIVIDKTSLPEMTVDNVYRQIKTRLGHDLSQHLNPVHDDHPRIKIVEYIGDEFIYQGKRYPMGSDNALPYDLCGPEVVDYGDERRGVSSVTSLQVLHKTGTPPPKIKNKCDSYHVVKYINSISDLNFEAIDSTGYGFGMYFRLLDIMLRGDEFKAYRG